jgi:N-acetylmuramoyl-L-alanine amidase
VLVEAGYQLGDRLLYHRTPMLRGDDVTALQRRLSELGFQSDRVDGIFGPNTAAAVESFQRNMGLVTDGVVGPEVLDQRRRLGSRTGAVTKAHLQERVTLLGASRFLAGTRVVLAEQGSLPALLRAVTQLLDQAGADTLAVHHPEGSVHAAEANRFGAQVFVGLCARAEPGARLSYYRTEGFESAGGRHLAEVVCGALEEVPLPQPIQIQGMRIPVLRETRMPALWCEVGPTSFVVEHAGAVAEAIAVAITSWVSAPLDDLGAN